MIYQPLKIKDYILKNRAVMAPMCMYSANTSGYANDFHFGHYYQRSLGGVSLVIQEATAVSKNGRISENDLGIWSDSHLKGLKKIVNNIHKADALAGIQISHAGRKAKVLNRVAPSSIQFHKLENPKELTKNEIKQVILDFKRAAIRANQANYDYLEIHAAHGYLINQFLSPITNKRTDEYQQKDLFLREILEEITKVWPKNKLLGIRISAVEYEDEGLTVNDHIKIINNLKKDYDFDIINVSTGGITYQRINSFPGYQMDHAKKIKEKTNILVLGGGLITNSHMADEYLVNNYADLIFFGRLLLREPFFLLNEALHETDITWPKQYIRGKK